MNIVRNATKSHVLLPNNNLNKMPGIDTEVSPCRHGVAEGLLGVLKQHRIKVCHKRRTLFEML